MKEKHIVLLFVLAAGAVVAGTVVAAMLHLPGHLSHNCGDVASDARAVAKGGDTLQVTQDGFTARAERTVTYAMDAPAALDLASCVSTGRLELNVSPDDLIHVEVTVLGHGSRSDAARAQAQGLEPIVRATATGLIVHEPPRSFDWDKDHATMSARILVPARVLVASSMDTGTGRVVVEGVRLSMLDASTGTGGIELNPSWAQGSLDASTGTGSIQARFPALGNATLDFSTGTSGIQLAVPGDARHGYDIDASTGTGGVNLDLPDLEREGDRPGRGDDRARTRGFDDRDVRVRIDASTGTGSITITTV
jgi:hypothetical protein